MAEDACHILGLRKEEPEGTEKEGKMLSMTILTWDPDKRDAVIERVKKIGLEHEGMKVIGTWVDVVGGRCYQLADVPRDIDPMLRLKANLAWNDLVRIRVVPVMDAMEMIKLMESMR